MALIDLRDMLRHAQTNGYTLAAVELQDLAFLPTVLNAAESCHAPLVLNVRAPHPSGLDFALLMPAVEAAAQRTPIPVAIQLSHGKDYETAVQAIRLGCNSLMIDFPDHTLTENIASTRSVTKMAHACGIPVEGSPAPFADEENSVGTLKDYVEQTGIDSLVLPDGTSLQTMTRLHQALPVPLAVCQNAKADDERYRQLAACGVVKAGCPIVSDTSDSGHKQVAAQISRCINLLGSYNRATEILAECKHWAQVDHVIIYNTTGLSAADAETMMAEGRRVLGAIPGVREVICGRALGDNTKYRYAWLIRFCHPAVIDSYREHPDHVAFADQHFRPVAGDRISIDYQRID